MFRADFTASVEPLVQIMGKVYFKSERRKKISIRSMALSTLGWSEQHEKC